MAAVTIPTDGLCDVILASNEQPALSLAYQDAQPHAYTRSDAPLFTTQVIAGRQMPLAFRPLVEGQGDVFQRVMLIAIDQVLAPLTTIDRSVFKPLVDLIDADVTHIAVCQGNGDRWYVAARPPALSMTQPGNAHHATVDFIEIAASDAPPFFEGAAQPTIVF